MTDEKVVRLPGTEDLPENPIQISGKQGWCQHPNINLDTHDRTVVCGNCGATLDPFDFLHSNARTLQTAWMRYRDVQYKVAEVEKRLHAMAKEEKRLRAQVKRLQDKTVSVNVRGDNKS